MIWLWEGDRWSSNVWRENRCQEAGWLCKGSFAKISSSNELVCHLSWACDLHLLVKTTSVQSVSPRETTGGCSSLKGRALCFFKVTPDTLCCRWVRRPEPRPSRDPLEERTAAVCKCVVENGLSTMKRYETGDVRLKRNSLT